MGYVDREKQLAAQMRYYYENKELSARQKRDRRNLRFKFLQDYKAAHPCVDCGVQYPFWVMQFDHLPKFEKSFNLSGTFAADKTMARIVAEIAKCDVVCANCHAHRTYVRSRS